MVLHVCTPQQRHTIFTASRGPPPEALPLLSLNSPQRRSLLWVLPSMHMEKYQIPQSRSWSGCPDSLGSVNATLWATHQGLNPSLRTSRIPKSGLTWMHPIPQPVFGVTFKASLNLSPRLAHHTSGPHHGWPRRSTSDPTRPIVAKQCTRNVNHEAWGLYFRQGPLSVCHPWIKAGLWGWGSEDLAPKPNSAAATSRVSPSSLANACSVKATTPPSWQTSLIHLPLPPPQPWERQHLDHSSSECWGALKTSQCLGTAPTPTPRPRILI